MSTKMSMWRQIWIGARQPWGSLFSLLATVVVGLFGGALVNLTITGPVILAPHFGEARLPPPGSPDAATTAEGSAAPNSASGRYEIPYRYWTKGGNVESIVATDEQGRQAALKIHTLSQEFNWTAGEDGVIELEGQPEQVHALRDHLRRMAAPGGRLYGARELIVVGTASCERGCAGEHELATQRATQLGIWLKEAKTDFGMVHRLVLGGWLPKRDCHQYSDRERRRQRRVLLLEVERRDAGVALEESLKAAIADSVSLDFEPEDYCDFDLDLVTG